MLFFLSALFATVGFYHAVTGTDDDETVYGSDLDDEIYGGGGDDAIDGGLGDDEVFGEDGADTLNGGVYVYLTNGDDMWEAAQLRGVDSADLDADSIALAPASAVGATSSVALVNESDYDRTISAAQYRATG